jgi:rare lipoprotein A
MRSPGVLLVAALSGCAVVGYPSGTPERAPVEPSASVPSPADVAGPERTVREGEGRGPEDVTDAFMASIPDAVPVQEERSRYGNPPEYEVLGRTYRVLATSRGYEAEGMASWYGPDFQGRRTSSGDPYDMYAMTAAHTSLPLPTYVEVTNLENGRRVVVRVNDRGPFHADRIIDLSYVAAWKLGMVGRGTARVRVRALEPAAR